MGRKLRVDFSNETGTVNEDEGRDRDGAVCPSENNPKPGNSTNLQSQSGPQGGNYPNPTTTNGGGSALPPAPSGSMGLGASGPSGTLPPLPQGKDLPPGVSCTDAISRTLNTLPPAQLLDILQQMKTLATSDPARATELLTQAPQLSYAIFQALLIMGLVSPDAINAVLEPGSAPPQQHHQQQQQQQMPYGGTPPVAAPGGYPPPPQQQAAPVAAPQGQDPDALMRAVMDLPQETIDQLPDAERQQIMALRASYATQIRR